MMFARRFLRRELGDLLSVVAAADSTTVIRVNHDGVSEGDLAVVLNAEPDVLLPADRLSQYLRVGLKPETRNIVLDGVLNRVDDVYEAIQGVSDSWCSDFRLINVCYRRFWRRFLKVVRSSRSSERAIKNWIPPDELDNLLEQTGFEVVERRGAVLLPIPIPILSRFVNRWLAPMPLLRLFCVYNIVVARPTRTERSSDPAVSIIVAARNEEGNIGPLLERIPKLSGRQEVILIEGGSKDRTWQVIENALARPREDGIVLRALKQTGKGKGDAVRLGFEHATGDILIILDADLSVPPEELPRFIDLLRRNTCEFANGSRLVYPMDTRAMQFLNLLGNRLFGLAFTFLLGQSVRDTLCGTKALWASDYRRIAAQRSYFGDFDPFGDFDLLFGAARLHLKIRDVPVHYKERVYGSTNISRFRHGLLLLRMTFVAARKLRFV